MMQSIPAYKDHSQLLDVIDLLRSQGINRHIPLPQLIACGNQSLGKNSVLKAVSGIRFPIKDTLYTRFAIEFILRKKLLMKWTLASGQARRGRI